MLFIFLLTIQLSCSLLISLSRSHLNQLSHNIKLNSNNFILPSTATEACAWFPIGSKSCLNPKFPNQVELLGEKFVVWKSLGKSENEWNVMSDACPHRLAPLSQGRIDDHSCCLQCPYHGIEFDSSGKCTKIPQLDTSISSIPSVMKVNSFPVKITGDMIWSYLPLPEGQASSYPIEPEVLFPVLNSVTSFVSRELPFSFDYVIENFMVSSYF